MNTAPISQNRWQLANCLPPFNLQTASLVASGVTFAIGMLTGSTLLVAGGAAGLCLLGRVAYAPRAGRLHDLAGLWRVISARQSGAPTPTPPDDPGGSDGSLEDSQVSTGPTLAELPASIESATDLVEAMIATHRYALLLRPESVSHLSEEEHQRTIAVLDDQMAIVPAGLVLTGQAAEWATLGHDMEGRAIDPSAMVNVEACYLDRRPVTNAEFQQFVDAGGYEQLDLWPEEALAALFDFVDQTGEPAPRYWRDRQHAPGAERLPVVGVSWYEAVAYAHWVGKRLPTDAEWTKACAWPIESAPGRVAQRRYPWGESFEPKRANLWVSGRGSLAPVDDYQGGVTIGGVEQMVGNVWEWTFTALNDATPKSVGFPSSLRGVRGGAFNTYFENQATCHFQSGESPLARRENIGLRLALSMSSLAGVS